MNFTLMKIADAGVGGHETGTYLHLNFGPVDAERAVWFRTICLESDDPDLRTAGARELEQLWRAVGGVDDLKEESELIGKTVNYRITKRGVEWAPPVGDHLAREYFKAKAKAAA